MLSVGKSRHLWLNLKTFLEMGELPKQMATDVIMATFSKIISLVLTFAMNTTQVDRFYNKVIR